MARTNSTRVSDLHVTIPGDDGATVATLLTAPSCPCGSGDPVSRFVEVAGAHLLACTACFKLVAHSGEITHHARSSHGDCDHEATPAERGRCRAARRKGETYVQDGFDAEVDGDISYTTIQAKGSARVHHILGDDLSCGAARPKTGVLGETDDAGDITCAACLTRLDDAA